MEFKLKKNTSAPVKFAYAKLEAGRYMRAMQSFLSIISSSPDDDQAMFGMALARYGVKDPSNPVCVYPVKTPFPDDYFFRNAMRLADDESAELYDIIAEEIEQSRIQAYEKGEKGKRCGIFFYAAFPENDNGGVTQALSDELYDALEDAGYDVIFTDISTEDPDKYPLLSKALEYANCLIIFGHTGEQLSSAGCENLFLSRLESAREGRLKAKSMITVYHHCPQNEIPEELSVGTLIDASEKGWIEKALAAVDKYIDYEVAPKAPRTSKDEAIKIAISGMEGGLAQRDFEQVICLADRTLKLDPDNEKVYFLRLLAKAGCSDEKELASHTDKLPENYDDYKTLESFGGEYFYIASECNEKAIEEKKRLAKDAEISKQRRIDEENRAKEEAKRREAIAAKAAADAGKQKQNVKAPQKPNDQQKENERKDDAQKPKPAPKSAPAPKQNPEQKKPQRDDDRDIKKLNRDFFRSKKFLIIAAAAVLLVILFIILIAKVFVPTSKYNSAIKLYNKHEYMQAAAEFEKLGSFSNSREMYKKSRYSYASSLFNSGNFRTAGEIYATISDYLNAAELVLECERQNAISLTGKDDPVYMSSDTAPYFTLNPATGALTFTGDQFDGTDLLIPDVFDGQLVTGISSYAFSGNSRIRSITVGSSVKNIGDYAFSNCSALEKITLPDCVETIGRYAFNNCIALKSIKLPDSLTLLPNNVFNSCSALESVTFGSNLESIGERSFFSCGKLKDIALPESLKVIGNDAFGECASLENVKFGSHVAEIGKNAFDGSKFLSSLSAEFVIVGDGVLLDYNGDGGNVKIPDGVKFIASAFNTCSSLKSVSIPEGCKVIGEGSFYKCTALEEIVIPDGVTEIRESAFYYCATLKSVTLPSSLLSIGDFAFYKCTALSSVKYAGTSADYQKISIGTSNTDFTGAAKVFGYTK